jgi:hypothetical protein
MRCSTIMAINRKEMNSKLDKAERHNDLNSSAQNAALDCIKDRIENANQSIEAGNSMLGKVSEALRLDWLRQLGSELKSLMRGAIAVNFATYRAVIRLQTSLPSRLEGGLIEEPVLLEDPLGRIAPVHLQFVTSWDAFNSVLELRFENMQGHGKMKQRDYGLQDGGDGKEIEQSRPWQRAFLPGQKVEMSFIFHREEGMNDGSESVTCPGCQTSTESSADADICCKQCLMWFRRIIVVEEDGSLPQTHLPQHWQPKPGFEPGLGNAVATNRKRAFPAEREDEDDVKEFKRVRLISTKRRIKHSDDTTEPKLLQPGIDGALLGGAGQVAPPGHKPRVTATLWEDEESLCFQVEADGIIVTRREDNHMINGTKLLSLAGMTRGRRDGMLKAEKTRHVVRIAPAHLKGVWVPFERALEFAVNEGIVDRLYPLFVHDIGALLYHPSNRQATNRSRVQSTESSRGYYPNVNAYVGY